jgi:hypothetical protein
MGSKKDSSGSIDSAYRIKPTKANGRLTMSDMLKEIGNNWHQDSSFLST